MNGFCHILILVFTEQSNNRHTMIREVIRLSQGKPLVPDHSQVSPLEAVQLEYEGPAATVEGGDQEGVDGSGRSRSTGAGGAHNPQQLPLGAAQLNYEGPAVAAEGGGHTDWTQEDYLLFYGGEAFSFLEQAKAGQADRTSQPKYASTDIRCREGMRLGQADEEEDRRSALVLIRDFNKFSCQGPGGTFDLTGFSSTKYCILCRKNCVCLSKCMGPPPKKIFCRSRAIPPPSTIPGLADGTAHPSTTLTFVSKSASQKHHGKRGSLRLSMWT
jgi:hypothetical protein